ncbi:diaminopimelate epimerase [Paenibacillus planticolens]|uniref:Diaminopimelate epimerase n=1 Tax=Paenibacillus planticolens TaxID=2654976 RepID=A0ABX1ZKJ2_9BACL|nr:diaminopimelate epimerase [Paenibacillus planticolens]NOV00614.1 diaminopimelate epimerase [Paenibacillus planticolens]
MTILVKSNHTRDEYKHIATKLMSYDHVHAEQVGFIEAPVNSNAAAHLQMAGGEFCGNACMALAAFIASERNMELNDSTDIVLEVSGTDELLTCLVQRKSTGFYCSVAMPIPQHIEERIIPYEGNDLAVIIVRYPDFIHIVIEVDEFHESIRNKAESLAKLLGLTLGANLIGILLYKVSAHELAPLIYVPHLDSMVWERGCGSGTASVGAYLAWKHKEKIAAEVKQPGGMIQVHANYNEEEAANLCIEGLVGIVAQGKAFIDINDSTA